MAIAKTPERPTSQTKEQREEAFIKKGALAKPEPQPEAQPTANKKPTMIRIPPDLIKRIDQGAKRLGITRSAFIVQSAAEKLERMAG
jgi:Ribbon-helix-helix protein, copG family